ncbi:MAG TPA: ATP-dependent Clp protease adaptor ClpS [Pyrinomonadaceae bacterium]|jgi:ATP-dependent Clp protease adaptor protein ClpS|nr:ATP-dependent Clp protease adaptor ClpS [Pyrinomonadaceae bacterium]
MPIKQPDYEYEEDVLTAGEEKIEEPPLYKVMLHNDNFTTMEFVVFILQSVFGRSETEAVQVMLQVHLGGVGVAGIYSYEIAQMKVEKVTTLAREYEYPLLCTMEEN